MGSFGMKSHTQWDEWANQLKKALLTKEKERKLILRQRPKPQGWIVHFKKLNERIETTRISQTLEWYCRHLGEEHLPRCYSGTTFCQRYESIEAAMRRGGGPEADRQIIISDRARQIQLETGNCIWPYDEKKDELAVIQLSLERFTEYRIQLCRLIKKYEAKSWIQLSSTQRKSDGRAMRKKCVVEVMANFDPFSSTVWWLGQLHRMAYDWKGWDGKLRRWVFHPMSKLYQSRDAKPRMADAGYTMDDWFEVMKEIKL
jgi:hypothetical protein